MSEPATSFRELLDLGPRAKLMILGTFHFHDPGLDLYKPRHAFDVLSEAGQAQVADVVARLSRFAPTKVAVEYPPGRREELDREYAAYLAGPGKSPGPPDEIHQVAFRLAARMGLERVHAIDSDGRAYFPDEQFLAYLKEHGREEVFQRPDPRFARALEYQDRMRAERPLRETLLWMNDRDNVMAGHGIYLSELFKLGEGDDYTGPDFVTGWWWNRNLRIFRNIQRVAESPEDRVFVLIGAGHLPILRHSAECSPDLEWVEVAEYLG